MMMMFVMLMRLSVVHMRQHVSLISMLQMMMGLVFQLFMAVRMSLLAIITMRLTLKMKAVFLRVTPVMLLLLVTVVAVVFVTVPVNR